MNAYIYVSTVIFFILSLAWRKGDWLNLFIKACLIAMTVIGGVLSASSLGVVLIK